MKKTTFVNTLFWILTFLPMALTLAAFAFMPDTIPAHWNAAGEVDRWSSKYELFIIPCAAIAVMMVFRFIASKLNSSMRNASMWCFCISGLAFVVINIWWLVGALNSHNIT